MNKNISVRFFQILFAAVLLTGCNKYLDVQPKGVRLLKTVNDYDLWLNNSALESSLPRELNLLADNSDDLSVKNPPDNSDDQIYTWQSQFNLDVTGYAPIWSNYYKCIYLFNAVIKNIDKAISGTEQKKNALKAEALLGRAFEYLGLVNLYGKVYNSATAGKDLAVPFVTTIDITDDLPNRSTVQEIYDHIITDITEALPNLPDNNSNNRFRGSKAAAYSVLARTYLYIGDYAKAAENAQLAIDNSLDQIIDYKTIPNGEAFPNLIRRPGVIYARLSLTYYYQETPTLNFLKSYDQKDLRLQFCYTNLGDFSFTERGKTYYSPSGATISYSYPNWGTSVAEMRLILAEAAARVNDLSTAITQLDLLRSKRFNATDYIKYDPANPVQEEVLQKVLKERTFEFAFNGMRWFDMRRLDIEDRMPEVFRYYADGTLITSLPPKSNKYTLQIPIQVMYFNPDWSQNPK